ncbi:DNA repair endonuclease UVH1 isoform X2 [Durio zibethinus]|uniref:DNA repair endonuclease UVH1 isoform X2 n=1 Tax=Durio zibethinus TaxID=66656 RepID=A0A6P5Y870_DURZI|nr:DNA repair endonuclease UVH1 isoform X2 [Durio zibethinus]
MVLKFHEQIVSDILEDPNGGVVILSSGLCLPKLLSSFLSLRSQSNGSLLLLHSPQLSSSLKSLLLSLSPNLPLSEITADLPSSNRLSLYSSNRILLLSPRILIVDLLTEKAQTSLISGVVFLNAHSLSESSTESFIVRIIKTFNKNASVYAFSDKPHSMVSGFAKTERIMKGLFIKRLHLWPRFQVNVSEELERDPPAVVDIRVPMSKYMLGIQKAIVEVMDACLKEMRKTNKVDVEDLTVENGLFKSFDEIVRRQLDPIWHTLGKKTKQLVSDLKTLRKLLDYLVRYDAVSYLKYLDTLRVSESFRSVWIFAESSYKIFDYAKKRVYRFARSDGTKIKKPNKNVSGKKRKLKEYGNNNDGGIADTSISTNNGVVLEEVLEESPKWKVLREVLEEIEEERQKQASSGEPLLDVEEDNNGIILVACKDERSCMQLEDCITNSPQKVMRDEWQKYLLSKVELRSMQTPQKKKPKKTPKGYGILDGIVPVTPAQNVEASSACKLEHEALLAAASEIKRNQAEKEKDSADDPAPQVGSRGHGKGKGRGRIKKGPANTRRSRNKDGSNNTEVATDDRPEISGSENEGQRNEINPTFGNGVPRMHIDRIDDTKTHNSKQLPPVHFHALERDQPILDVLRPSVIIVYHPDMTFVREIEVYKAENPEKKLKVYFLFYEASTEVQKFEASIRRENGAFESLIRQKSMMMIPVDQNGFRLGLNSSSELQGSSSQNSITRKAGGRKETEKEMQIIVDMREFMSSLPNVLHQKGMRIIPVTLEVGDYVLSPLICVERKSIQDLFMSFTSGRLYHQVETMARYYRIPVLLIEFSQDKSFSFQTNQDEPDEAKAMRVGVPSEEGFIENDVRAENYNTSAVEFLRRLPGVTDSNYRAIMDGCKSLAELALLPMEKLAELMGGRKAAQTLRDFLDAKYPTLL